MKKSGLPERPADRYRIFKLFLSCSLLELSIAFAFIDEGQSGNLQRIEA